MIKCFIDNREKNRVEPAKKYYENAGFETAIAELVYGDYVFTDENITVAFEYKTADDFIGSTRDYRVFNQALNQSENFNYHFVIIVGNEKQLRKAKESLYRNTGSSFTDKQWNGSIASLVEFTSILQVKNQSLAFDLMERVAKKCIRDKPVIHRFPKTKGVPAYRFLCNNVNGIAEKTAKRIVEDLGLWSIVDVLRLSKKDLMSVKGVGGKTAENILRQVMGEYS